MVNCRNVIGLANSSGWLALATHSRQRESSCLVRILPPNNFRAWRLVTLQMFCAGKVSFAMVPALMSVAEQFGLVIRPPFVAHRQAAWRNVILNKLFKRLPVPAVGNAQGNASG